MDVVKNFFERLQVLFKGAGAGSGAGAGKKIPGAGASQKRTGSAKLNCLLKTEKT